MKVTREKTRSSIIALKDFSKLFSKFENSDFEKK